MDNLLFPEEILKTQICSNCKQYLSYGPIKLFISEGAKCGRCLRDTGEASEEAVPSLLNIINRNVIFPCVNRFDGCNVLLKCEDVPNHEKVCEGSSQFCPICVNQFKKPQVEYSLLSLIHHFQIFHNSCYLTKSSISINTNSAKEYTFLYCNEYKNILAFINLKCIAGKPYVKIYALGNSYDKIVCNLKSHVVNGNVTVTECSSSEPIGESYFELVLPSNTENSTDEICLELEFSLLDITNLFISLEESEVGSEINVKSSLDNEPTIKAEDFKYFGEPYDDFMNKRLLTIVANPIYVIENQKTSCGEIQFIHKEPDYTDYSSKTVNIMCSFCENYFLLSGVYYHCEDEEHIFDVCVNCYERGVVFCRYKISPFYGRRRTFRSMRGSSRGRRERTLSGSHFCDSSLMLKTDKFRNPPKFTCRHQCGIVKADRIFSHEEVCINNPNATLSNSEFAKIYFGDYFIESSNEFKSIVIRNDNRVSFERQFFGLQGRIYMVTDSGFCCIIFYKSDQWVTHFSVAHKYPLDKYYTLFKIVEPEIKPYQESINAFAVNLQTRKFFFVVSPRKCTE